MPGYRTKKPRVAGKPPIAIAVTASQTNQGQSNGASRKPKSVAVDPSAVVESRHFSERRFQDAPISIESKAGIQHEFMSDVQAATLDLALAGTDLLVQAKTGTGKTLAFLLPAVERLLSQPSLQIRGTSILILAPTRELALQIEEEARALLAKHRRFTVASVIGGTNINRSYTTMLSPKPPTILIATPGRLLDLLTSPVPAQFSKSQVTVADQFAALKTIVYDEADRLLDQGFKRDLDAILRFLPDKNKVPRQAMLFSATVSNEIKEVAAGALRSDYKFVSTLAEDEVNTHEHVSQSYIITPFTNVLPMALHILRQELVSHSASTPSNANTSTSKTIIFFPTARHVSLAAELLAPILDLPPLFEIHSRKSQSARSKASEGFKNAKCGVLLSSDVAARGMDFPGVTLVLQLGLPADSDQYIHRLGRTARAGAGGRGIVVLSPPEASFLRRGVIQTLPITPHPDFHAATVTTTPRTPLTRLTEAQLRAQAGVAMCAADIAYALRSVAPDTKAAAYRAWLGYYNGKAREMGWGKEQLVVEAERYVVESLGWEGLVPEVEARAVGMMGLRGVPGLRVVQGKIGGRGGGGGGGRSKSEGTRGGNVGQSVKSKRGGHGHN